jgi:hypothetical protein
MSNGQSQIRAEKEKEERKRMIKWLVSIGLLAIIFGYLLFAEHPPYPPTFNIDWEEEVQVSASRTIWIHHTEVFQRRSRWSHWDARKITEALAFESGDGTGKFSYELKGGVFRGLEQVGADWIIEYAEDIHYPSLGSCVPGEGTECYVVIKPDGTFYKPKNRVEILNNFGWLISCRTAVAGCVSRFQSRRISLVEKQNYIRENSRFGDGNSPAQGQFLKQQEMQ